MPSFTVEETVCLSIGVEPANFPAPKLRELEDSPPSELWPALQFLVRRYDELKRQFLLHSFRRDVQPKDFLEWAQRVEFEVHPEFQRLLKARHLDNAPKSVSAADGKKPDRREIDKIAQLFTAMAIDYLGYVPGDARSPICLDPDAFPRPGKIGHRLARNVAQKQEGTAFRRGRSAQADQRDRLMGDRDAVDSTLLGLGGLLGPDLQIKFEQAK